MAKLRTRAPYPFMPGSHLESLADPRVTWDRLLADFAAARERLLIENYIFEDGQAGEAVASALIAAAERGVDVRVLVDSVGSVSLTNTLVNRMTSAGVQLKFFNPFRLSRFLRMAHLGWLHRRTHRRIVAIDRRVGWVGGLAFADDWWPQGDECATRETMLRFEGKVVANLEESFFRLWEWPPRYRRARPLAQPNVGDMRLVPQYARSGPWFRRAIRRKLMTSRERAWLATPYFIPPRSLRRHLKLARRRGVDVRLLLPGIKHDHRAVWFAGRRYYGPLLRAGVRIWEYKPRFMHAKTALFDSEWSLIGSPNLDRWSLFILHELAVEARDSGLNRRLAEQFEADMEESREITLTEWKERPLRNRLLEHFFGIFDSAF